MFIFVLIHVFLYAWGHSPLFMYIFVQLMYLLIYIYICIYIDSMCMRTLTIFVASKTRSMFFASNTSSNMLWSKRRSQPVAHARHALACCRRSSRQHESVAAPATGAG